MGNMRLVQIKDKFHCVFVEHVVKEELDETKQILISNEDRLAIGVTKCFDVENNRVIDYDNSEDLKRQENNKFKNEKIKDLKEKLKELTYDFIQAQTGAIVPDIEAKTKVFKEYHNELRELLGKKPRLYL